MAAILPIQYAKGELRGQNPAYTNTEVNTGGAAIGRAISQIGEVLSDKGAKIQLQKDNADLAEAKRKIGEAGWSARSLVNGEEGDLVLWDKFQNEANDIIKKYSPNVQRMARNYLNGEAANWKHGMEEEGLRIKKANAKDKVSYEIDRYLENGYQDEAVKILDNARTFSPEDKVYYDNLESELPVKMKLLQANKLLQLGKPDMALETLDSLNSTNLSGKQLEYANSIKTDIDRLTKKAKDTQYEKTVNIYKEFIPLILSKQLSATMIESSELSKTEKENEQANWQEYIKSAYTKEPPQKSLPEGYDTVREVILSFSINDVTFTAAIKKLSNPYPQYMANQMDDFLAQIPNAEKKMDAMLEIEDVMNDPKKVQDIMTRYTTKAKEEKAKTIISNYEKSKLPTYSGFNVTPTLPPQKEVVPTKYPTIEDYIEYEPTTEVEFDEIMGRYKTLIKSAKTNTKKQYYTELSKEYYDKWKTKW
jgi:hypothetical protein